MRKHFGRILALPLQHADLLGQGVALRLKFLGARLQGLAFGFQRLEFGKIDGLATLGQTFGNGIKIGAELLDIEHVGFRLRAEKRGLYASPKAQQNALAAG